MKNYNVHFLDDQEFESLPYKNVDLALGLADSKTGQAYVRRTGVSALDMHTAMHELEHLEEGRSGTHADHEHYGDGVYYKDMGGIFKSILPIAASFIPGIGPILGPALGMGMSAMDRSKQQQQQPQVSMPQQPQMQMPSMMGASKPNVIAPQASSMGGNGGVLPGGQSSPIDLFKQKKAGYAGGLMQ